MAEKKSIRFSLELTPETNAKLEELANEIHGTKADVLRRAIALIEVAITARNEGKKFGIASPGQQLATEIIGI